METTIVALETPHGAGGIAVVRLSGPESYRVTGQVFRPMNPEKKVSEAKGYTAMFGHFIARGKTLDEGVALFFRAPRSYTGEDVVELSCHGGMVIAQELITACIAAGAEPAGPGEYTKRAFLNGRMSLTQAEAVMDLIGAAGRQGAALAESALSGALARQIEEYKNQLVALAGHLAAWVDFPEEDVPDLEENTLRGTLEQVCTGVRGLIGSYGGGAVLRQGVDAAIVGSPNVGKSTLMNLLAGFDRAIVTPIAGTTRDVVEQAVMLGGVRVNLFDTAGLRETGDVVEAEGIRRSFARLEQAGFVLAVFDASQPADKEDAELAQKCAGRPALAILNKTDLPRRFDEQVIVPYFSEIVSISANDPAFLSTVEQAAARVLGVAHLDEDAMLLANERQLACAKTARNALAEALDAVRAGFTLDAAGVCIDDALNALYALTGENASDDVIEEVFSKFCVGK